VYPTQTAGQYEAVYDEVKMYSIHASPRRNGNNIPIKALSVKKSFWELANWPGPNTEAGRNPLQYDYGVVRFNREVPTGTDVASRQVMASPIGKTIVVAHYPMQETRGFGMFYSIGKIGSVLPGYPSQVIRHSAGAETDSSGSGIFEETVGAVSGVNVAEVAIRGLREKRQADQTVAASGAYGPHPNYALMFTAATLANANMWIDATW
jgi:hypothetical protein